MESDFINIVNELMFQKETDLRARLASQEEALDELTCVDRRFGQWFEEHTVPYVMSAFNLSDRDFASMFPPLKHLSTAQRQQIIQGFKDHIDNCPRCFRKRSYDLEFEGRLESALQDNREYLLTRLHEEETDKSSKEKHVIDGKARFAHHS